VPSPVAASLSSALAQDRFGFYRVADHGDGGGGGGGGGDSASLHGLQPSAALDAAEVRLEAARARKWLARLSSASAWAAFAGGAGGALKAACRKGVPDALRGVAWQRLAGADVLAAEAPGLYASLLRREPS